MKNRKKSTDNEPEIVESMNKLTNNPRKKFRSRYENDRRIIKIKTVKILILNDESKFKNCYIIGSPKESRDYTTKKQS